MTRTQTPERKFSIVLTKDGRTDEAVHSFTWGRTYAAAYARIATALEDPFWTGWSFEIDKTPVG
jgi:hypothetical protein